MGVSDAFIKSVCIDAPQGGRDDHPMASTLASPSLSFLYDLASDAGAAYALVDHNPRQLGDMSIVVGGVPNVYGRQCHDSDVRVGDDCARAVVGRQT